MDRIQVTLGVDLDSAHVRAELLLYLTGLPLDQRQTTDCPTKGPAQQRNS
jgi:hypothetical protein